MCVCVCVWRSLNLTFLSCDVCVCVTLFKLNFPQLWCLCASTLILHSLFCDAWCLCVWFRKDYAVTYPHLSNPRWCWKEIEWPMAWPIIWDKLTCPVTHTAVTYTTCATVTPQLYTCESPVWTYECLKVTFRYN